MAEEHVVSRLSEEDLEEVVMALVRNDIFTSAQIQDTQMLPSVFMPIVFGAFKGWTEEELSQIGMLYEYYDKAGSRSINGYPIFGSLHYVHKDDWTIIHERFKAAKEAAEAAAKG